MRNTNGLNRNGRKRGATNLRTRLEQQAIADMITNDEYCSIIRSVVDVALNGKEDSDRLRAAKIIIERVEGRIPKSREIEDDTGRLTFRDLIESVAADDEAEQQEYAKSLLVDMRKGKENETTS